MGLSLVRKGGQGDREKALGTALGAPRTGGENPPSRGRLRHPPNENAADRSRTEQGVLTAHVTSRRSRPPAPPRDRMEQEGGQGWHPQFSGRQGLIHGQCPRVSLRDTRLWGSWGSVMGFGALWTRECIASQQSSRFRKLVFLVVRLLIRS